MEEGVELTGVGHIKACFFQKFMMGTDSFRMRSGSLNITFSRDWIATLPRRKKTVKNGNEHYCDPQEPL